VRLHVLLEVEVGHLITALHVEESLELGVWDNATTVLRVLKLVLLDVSRDELGHIRARHEGVFGLAEELGELLRNRRRLHEPTGSTGTLVLVALRVHLIHGASLLEHLLLESLEVRLELVERRSERLNARREARKKITHGTLNGDNWFRRNFDVFDDWFWHRGRSRGSRLLGRLGRGRLGSLGGGFGSGFLGSSGHLVYTL